MVVLKSAREIGIMRRAGAVVARILAEVQARIKPGVTTAELDRLAERLCAKFEVEPAFKGYRGYPFALCCSVNEEVVHGFPGQRRLEEGDILSMDFGVKHRGYFGDAALTVGVGRVSAEAGRLMDVTREALAKGIEACRAGRRLMDVSTAVQQHAEAAGFAVVRQFVGHGIGRQLHEEPQVPNFVGGGRDLELKTGLVLAIEPMINAGGYEVTVKEDGWTAVTADGSLSAHFEHTVAVTEDGPQILSLP
jgi:methionyl aminopeptidase